ncbi:hypothetical protein Patl1_30495 [Pistacia atlantica]|uniref:Uncharacterized protein n=1 Tax=Pistacia atlantica TaxID=434234 RepID=A0ACC1A9F1_9ROSI|nr:hypothetical protein Patl1_30495 [Pistacia atlantica]
MPTQEDQLQQQQQQQEEEEEEENEDQEEEEDDEEEEEPPIEPESSSETSDDEVIGEDDYYVTDNEDEPLTYVRPGDEPPASDNTAETNIRRFTRLLNSKRVREELEEEEQNYVTIEDLYNFPEDPENWKEEDLKELWADAPLKMTKPGWDPVWADEDDWEVVREEIEAGRDPPIAPFYLPYRKHYPAIPDNHYDISNPKAVVEELDRIEEFLTWVSYIFADGSSYEGTVWDDLAHGKGVYIAEQGLVRYEGEWLQNNMDGHGVVEVDIPDIEPVPGSKYLLFAHFPQRLEAKMRAEGKIISRDFMSPEDKKWLEMDIEDSIRLADGRYEIPFYENDEWIKQFGRKPHLGFISMLLVRTSKFIPREPLPYVLTMCLAFLPKNVGVFRSEKGRYRYAGQWKLGRMHGCGLYEVNENPISGRFYFGELLEDSEGCDEENVALHAGLAEVAAAKARMFVNKPDGSMQHGKGTIIS